MNSALVRFEKVMMENMVDGKVSYDRVKELIKEYNLMSFRTWSFTKLDEKELRCYEVVKKYKVVEVYVVTKECLNKLEEEEKRKEEKKAMRKELKELKKRVAELEKALAK